MKTKRVITADDLEMAVKITVDIATNGRAISRSEHLEARDRLVSRIMEQIPSTPYLKAELCDVKVS